MKMFRLPIWPIEPKQSIAAFDAVIATKTN